MKSHMNVTLMIKTFNNINSLDKLFTKSKLKVCGKSIPNNNQLIRRKKIILEKNYMLVIYVIRLFLYL